MALAAWTGLHEKNIASRLIPMSKIEIRALSPAGLAHLLIRSNPLLELSPRCAPGLDAGVLANLLAIELVGSVAAVCGKRGPGESGRPEKDRLDQGLSRRTADAVVHAGREDCRRHVTPVSAVILAVRARRRACEAAGNKMKTLPSLAPGVSVERKDRAPGSSVPSEQSQ